MAQEVASQQANPADDTHDETISSTRQFVIFTVGNEVFAVDMAPVREIIRMPEVVRVPLAPVSLEGLANLRGQVLPIISLRSLFDFPERPADDSTRVVVVDVGQSLGFVVDKVASVVGVEPVQIEDTGAISSAVDSKMLSGIIKNVSGQAMIMVLDFASLIERKLSHISAALKSNRASATASVVAESREAEKVSDELQLVSLHIEGQEYAVSIKDVQEIVQVPEEIIQVPGAEAHVLGLMTLRNRLLPIVSLRLVFGLADRPLDEKSRIVVLALDRALVGLAVDGVSEVLRVAKSSVEAMPPLLVREGENAGITEICRLGDGSRLVSIITARKLFGDSAIKNALNALTDAQRESGQEGVELQEDTLDDDEQVVVFRLGSEEFGVPIESVQEIVRIPEDLTRVPKAPASVEGVINLRGSVLPVIDLRRRLGLEQVARSDRQRIMVFLLTGLRTGFIVDQVSEVLKIPKAAIEPAPQFSAEQGLLLSRMANLENQKRIVQLIDPSRLLEGRELTEVAAAAKAAHDQTAGS